MPPPPAKKKKKTALFCIFWLVTELTKKLLDRSVDSWVFVFFLMYVVKISSVLMEVECFAQNKDRKFNVYILE